MFLNISRVADTTDSCSGKNFELKFIPKQSDLFWNLYPIQIRIYAT